MLTEYSIFVPKLKEVNEGLLYMKEEVDKINGADFHLIETNYFWSCIFEFSISYSLSICGSKYIIS